MANKDIAELEQQIFKLTEEPNALRMGESEWIPQFNYWRRPEKLDDGGENILE